ncbi:MAG: DUF4153 domain-containing protein [Rhodobacteraceae bacterium]|nr:DUF4153 domain-containing protein [Paracoccaceae bacterium]
MKRFGQAFLARGTLAVIGAMAGLSLWWLVQHRDLMGLHPQVYLFGAVLSTVFFGATLSLAGPLSLPRAMASALALAVAVALLMTWASLRFAQVPDFLSGTERMAAALLIAMLPLPYLIAGAGRGWLDYPTLFAQSWSIVVRIAAAWIFVAVIWILVYLSDALLNLAGVSVIADLIARPGVSWGLTGAVLGLAIAVVNELTDYVSPDLALRLLRLLVPVVLAVSVLFLIALPIHGLSTFYGRFSSAQTLLAMAVGAALLVSTALGEGEAEAVRAPVMVRATQGLALILPLLAALGAAGVWLRVAQYGWTPPRIASALVAVTMLGYGVIYAVAVLGGEGWAARIRRGNGTMALAVLAGTALTFTPLLDAQRISATSQLVRYTSGRLGVGDLDLAAMRNDWGLAGAATLAQLTALAAQPGQEALQARLTAAAAATPESRDESVVALRRALRARLPLRPAQPAGTPDPLLDALLGRANPGDLRAWLDACGRSLPDGRPGCVLVSGSFLPDRGGPQAILLYRAPTGALRADAAIIDPLLGYVRLDTADLGTPATPPEDAAEVLAAVLDGAAPLAPARINALTIGAHQIMIRPWP